jgi:hypothetical protein
MACPIYNIEYVPSSRIGISSIPPNLSKLQQWPLYITSGSFTKFPIAVITCGIIFSFFSLLYPLVFLSQGLDLMPL